MPGGFPLVHARFWTNAILPLASAVVCLSCLWNERRGNAAWRLATATTLPIFWFAAGVMAILLFPQSARRFGVPGAGCAVVIGAVYWVVFRRARSPRRIIAVSVATTCIVAVGFVWAQRAPQAATRPVNVELPHFAANIEKRLAALPVTLSNQVTIYPGDGRVHLNQPMPEESLPTKESKSVAGIAHPSQGPHSIEIQPVLSFESRSPDRFWTIFASRPDRIGPTRELVTLRRDESALLARYRDDSESVLKVVPSGPDDATAIEAWTHLAQPIYSHLNSYASITVRGCQRPGLAFSPCTALIVDVEPFDYPFGRPLRLAYIDAHDRFHVVRARSGEKGPFTEFGSGELSSGNPLTITVYDSGIPICRISLDDWAAQASRDLSPTAGWGLPVNAIEFSEAADPSMGSAPIVIWATLSGTSVGRGWDSVGYSPGVYRNRMRVEWLGDSPQ